MTMFRKSAPRTKESPHETSGKSDWTDDGERARHKAHAGNNSWSARNTSYQFGGLIGEPEEEGPKSRVRKTDTRRLRRFDTQRTYMRSARKPVLIILSMFAWMISFYLLTHASEVNAITRAYEPLLAGPLKTASVGATPHNSVGKEPVAHPRTTKKTSKLWPQRRQLQGR